MLIACLDIQFFSIRAPLSKQQPILYQYITTFARTCVCLNSDINKTLTVFFFILCIKSPLTPKMCQTHPARINMFDRENLHNLNCLIAMLFRLKTLLLNVTLYLLVSQVCFTIKKKKSFFFFFRIDPKSRKPQKQGLTATSWTN